MSLRTPLGRVRGLGAARNGSHHWRLQRLTAIALIPLGVWFLASMAFLAGADYLTVKAWLSAPLPAILVILFAFALFYHLKLGLQVVIEDYVHDGALKLFLQVTVSFSCIGLGLAATLAVLKLFLGA